jgi:succinate dehydrogenase/fumarate reductase cytochrome b subunit
VDSSDVTSAARRAGDHPVIEAGARLGYAVNGLMHLLIAWLGVQLALGSGGGSADQSGALATLAGNGLGKVLLIVAVAGFALLALWQVAEALGRGDAGDRIKAGSKAVLYAALAFSALSFLRGSGKASGAQTQDFTVQLMAKPMGRALVAALGLVVVGVAVYHVVKGARKKFLDDLREHPGRWAVIAGQVGYIAKGAALLIVGGMFVVPGLQNNAAETTGLDGALRSLLELPYGKALLIAVSVGFAAYAVYSFARSRYAEV